MNKAFSGRDDDALNKRRDSDGRVLFCKHGYMR